jgi:hypothetical protein
LCDQSHEQFGDFCLRQADSGLTKEFAIAVAQRVKASKLFLPWVGFEKLLLCDFALIIPAMPLTDESALSQWKFGNTKNFVTLAAISPLCI